MITDDQVASLLREAGSAGPLPRPLDPGTAVARARAARQRGQAVLGLAVAASLVVLVAAIGRDASSQAAGGGGTEPVGPYWWALAPLVLQPAVLVLGGIATPFVRRLPLTSGVRVGLAAVFGVLAVSLLSFSVALAAVAASPELILSLRGGVLVYVAAEIGVVLLLGGLSLLGRRVLRPGSLRPWSGVVAGILAFQAGAAVCMILLRPAYIPSRSPSPFALMVVALLALLAVVAARGAKRGSASGSSWSRPAGAVLLLASAAGASMVASALLGLLGNGAHERGTVLLVTLLVGFAAGGVLGGRLALGWKGRGWRPGVLAALAAIPAALAGTSLDNVSRGSTGSLQLPTSALAAGVVLAGLAVLALVALDRSIPPDPAPGQDVDDEPYSTGDAPTAT